jgi:hypothetical protein
MYVQLGVAGLRALENYNLEDHVCHTQRTDIYLANISRNGARHAVG